MGVFNGLTNPASQTASATPPQQPGAKDEKLFRAVVEQNKFERLNERFSQKDFVSENRFWRLAALVTSWLINCISICGAFYGAFTLFSYFGAGENISTLVSLVLLVLVELARRKGADTVFDKWFRFKKVAAGFIVLNLVLLVISSTSSGYGIYKGITGNSQPAPTLTDSTLTKMEGELAALRSDTETAKKIKWRGTQTVDAQRTIKNNSKAIANLTEQINDRRARLTGKQDIIEVDHSSDVERAAWIAVCVFLFLEILFQCCMAFMSYFDWREYVLRLEQGQKSLAATAPPHPQQLAISAEHMRQLVNGVSQSGFIPFLSNLQPLGTVQQSGATLPTFAALKTLDNSGNGENTQAQTVGETQGATGRQIVSVPTDIFIEHKNRTTGKKQRMNITEVRRNLSANLSRLRKAKHQDTVQSIGEQVAYWQAKEAELIEKFRQLEAVG